MTDLIFLLRLQGGIAVFGAGCLMFTMLTLCLMFLGLLYRYNVTCKTSSMSTIFNNKNICIFLLAAGVFGLIEAILLHYSRVDSSVGFFLNITIILK
jgi:hypothetical protein